MRKLLILMLPVLMLALFLVPLNPTLVQGANPLTACQDFAFSTEEDFITQGPEPPDGNPIISDGDLLSRTGAVCMRNAQLVQQFDVTQDMGLDAVDVLDLETELVAFSTELNSPYGNFKHGDLLTTGGAVIPNQVLLTIFQVSGDRGLDGVHFTGTLKNIVSFAQYAATISRANWLSNPDMLVTELQRYNVDIWFSIEGTELTASTVPILDGDLLSAATGTVIAGNTLLLPAGVPAGIPTRGVDFGLDGVTAERSGSRTETRFSTEILYHGQGAFTDGDILKIGNGVVISDSTLYSPFEPKADFLGTDALFIRLDQQPINLLPLILNRFRGVLQ